MKKTFMNNSNIIELIKSLCYGLSVLFLTIIICFLLTKQCNRNENQMYINADNAKIDSIITENDSIKTEIINLETKQNEDIEAAKTLDNDSTLKLFYKLISK